VIQGPFIITDNDDDDDDDDGPVITADGKILSRFYRSGIASTLHLITVYFR